MGSPSLFVKLSSYEIGMVTVWTIVTINMETVASLLVFFTHSNYPPTKTNLYITWSSFPLKAVVKLLPHTLIYPS